MESLTQAGKATASGVWWELGFVAATCPAAGLLSADQFSLFAHAGYRLPLEADISSRNNLKPEIIIC